MHVVDLAGVCLGKCSCECTMKGTCIRALHVISGSPYEDHRKCLRSPIGSKYFPRSRTSGINLRWGDFVLHTRLQRGA